jgi:mono/diheme cytochrome c family protein
MILLAACVVLVLPGDVPRLPEPAPRPVDFARDVEPILERHCLNCHGPKKQKSGFRLDGREPALRGGDSGKAPIVVGKSADSRLIRFAAGLEADLLMPPADDGKPTLSKDQISLLRAWIDQGAAWPATIPRAPGPTEWWSLAPLVRRAPPGTGHPVDAFVRARLRETGLSPAGEADRRTLVRRLYFDLIGLPPTPEEADAFATDRDPLAYEKLVDRLLASPRYAEHWARHWLDVVGYADTHGNDHDYARPNAWPYRDYVVRSLNEDKPYARFLQEQIAGDALFPADPQATVALGFLAAGPWDDTLMATVREDTVDHRLSQYLDRDNMVTTVMGTFQSLTVHCARCHNHKFDPITQREYFGLQAVFAGVDRADRPFDADPRTHVRRGELLARKRALTRRAPKVLAEVDSPATRKRVADAAAALERRDSDWTPLEVVNVVSMASAEGTLFARQTDGSWLARGARPDKDTFVVTARTGLRGLRAVRLEVLPDDSLPHRGPGRYDNGNFHLSEFRATAQPQSGPTRGAVKLKFATVSADHADGGDVAANALDGRDDTYWSVHPRHGESHEAVFELQEPAGYAGGTTLTLFLDFKGKPGHQVGRFRLSACTDSLPADRRPPMPAALAAMLRKFDKATPAERREIAFQFLRLEVDRELAGLPAPRLVYAAAQDFPVNGSFGPSPGPRPVHLLTRGDINKPGELVGPGALSCLPGLAGEVVAADADESARRAMLARWLADDRNVLTWRSIVNRVWHYHFGRGLCDTPNDFGRMGGVPSHPELLDWLAVWFRDDAKGSLKALHRLLVTSAAYRRATADGPAARVDADNRLLWRTNRTRLAGEQVRDAVLQMSGRLDLAMGGPAAVQFVHRGPATFMTGGAPPFVDYAGFDPDAAENRRRSIYRFVFRTVPDPFMDALDCPDGSATTPARGASTTAAQALAMLNDAFLIRQCEHMSRLLGSKAATPEARVDAAFRLILLRSPTAKERDRFADYARRHGLANVCHVLLNSNEFLYID